VALVKVQSLEIIAYRLPLKSALTWGKHGRLEAAEHALIRITLENGAQGIAEAPPRPTIYGETIASMRGIVAHLEPRLRELEVTDVSGIKHVLSSVPANNVAKGALDMALWDARSKLEGRGLLETLGGATRPVEASFILGIASSAQMLEEARSVVASGVRVLKVKVGRDTDHDLGVIRALRAEFGESVKLYADSNETLEPATAPRALELMREAGLLYVEEPLPARAIRARAELRRHAILPIIADDSCFTPADLERELDFDTFDILNVKTARNGFTDSLEMMRAARAAGKGVMIGSQASTTLGTVHAAMISSRAEVTHPCELSFFLKLQTDIVTRLPRIENGLFDLEDALGITVDAQKLEAHAHSRNPNPP
jgi:L-alanine-DL-glutamate epimerase-like enolase superfamily enzyme